MFRLLLVLLLIYQLVGIVAQEEPSSCVDYRFQRTLFNIVWGCVSTTIICAWASIHPNIPPREGPFKGALRRLELMFWTIVAPEILPCWALNQLWAAITTKDVYNNRKRRLHRSLHETRTDYERKTGIWKTLKAWFSLYEIKEPATEAWTVAHGHFLIMGGFHIVEPPTRSHPAGRVTILTLEMLRKLVEDPEFEIHMSEEEITHRSKGDALSKIIFVMQSTWFICQCVGRWIQGLNLTHLELTTLALASLNGITFILWWDKPLGAQAIVRVYLKRDLTDSERWQGRNYSWRSHLTSDIQEYFDRYVTNTIRGAFLCQSEWLVRLPFAIILVLLFPILSFGFASFANLNDILVSPTSFPPDDTHVLTFYVPEHRYSVWYHTLLIITLGSIFGAIHCSGWNFSFPTHAEQKIWRIAALVVTIIPIAILPLGLIVTSIIQRQPLEFEPNFGYGTPGLYTSFLCILVYVSARLVLLGLALGNLRHLPPTAFIAINWSKFYPHIV